MRSVASVMMGAVLVLGELPAASAQEVVTPRAANVLTEVSFTPREDALEFVFRGRSAFTLNDVTLTADTVEREVINLRVDGVRVTRRWVTMPDRQIERSLLHPDGDGERATVLRVRLRKAIDAATLKAARFTLRDGAIIVQVPRDELIASTWTAAKNPPVPVVVPAPKTLPAPVPVAVLTEVELPAPLIPAVNEALPAVVETPSSAAPSATAVPTSTATTAPESATTAVEAPASAAPFLLDDLEAAEENPQVVSNLGGPNEGPGFTALAATAALLFGGGFFLLRRMRPARPDGSGGPMIRPIGTHVLGPKQGLLLLDVAGQMVLLGTSEKGVQMLTTIDRGQTEPRGSLTPTAPAPSPSKSRYDVAADPLPIEPVDSRQTVTKAKATLSVADRMSAAIAKVREIAENKRKMETADEDVATEPAERAFFDRADEHLAEAADGVADSYVPVQNDFTRALRRSESRAVKTPTPLAKLPTPTGSPGARVAVLQTSRPEARPEARNERPANDADRGAMHNDILRKIRQMQGA